jgi:hypothetical protein
MHGKSSRAHRSVRLGGLLAATSLGTAATILAGFLLASAAPRAAASPAAVSFPGAGGIPPRSCEGDGAACAIERTVRYFIASAVERDHVAASFSLVTPELRQGLTEQQWATGDIPVPRFEAVDWDAFSLRFSDMAASARYYRLHLQSEEPAYGDADFWIGLENRASHWLVSYFAPAANFGAPSAG